MTTRPDSLLDTLGLLHKVLAVLLALFGCIPVIHVVIGYMMVTGKGEFGEQGAQVGELIGPLFLVGGVFAILLMQGLALAAFRAGKALVERRDHKFCLIVAGVECLFTPLGTALGVITIVQLVRDEVKALFRS